VIQNFGGMVVEGSADPKVKIADSIAHCLRNATVQHLIVCGHTRCRSLAALLGKDAQERLKPFRQIRESISRRFELYEKRSEHEWLKIIAQETVLLQLAALNSDTSIRFRLSNGSLQLHGWMRDDQTSAITAFDPTTSQFST